MTASTKPLRADARRNREKIVEAARAAFAERGLATQMDDVAQRAEVGVGTLYRHFPTKDALLAALIEAKMADMAAHGRAVLEAPTGDPFADFAGFIRTCASTQSHDRGLSDALATQPPETFRAASESTGLVAASGELLRRAQAAGTARADATPDDIGIVMCGLGAVLHAWGPDAGARYLDLLLDAFSRS